MAELKKESEQARKVTGEARHGLPTLLPSRRPIGASAGIEGDSASREAPPRVDAHRLRQRHKSVLLLSAVVVSAAFVLQTVPEGRVAVWGLESHPLPHTCLVRVLLGARCPSCGLTRSFVHLAHGRWAESVAVHPVGWLLAVAVVLQFPYRLAALFGANPLPLGRTVPLLFGWSLLAVVFVTWLVELLEGGAVYWS